MIAAYVVLDGFDLGAGIIYLVVGKTGDERRKVLRGKVQLEGGGY
jgi:cytochrome d ubiquinol oxidase subunit II